MSDVSDALDSPASNRPGRLSRLLLRTLMKQARVAAVEQIVPNFKLFTLESPSFKEIRWVPGHKIQIAMGSAFVARTFTPIDWDAAAGRTRILGYAHGDGPRSDWVRRARVGDTCDVFGPRSSIDGNAIKGAAVLFGDETSVGLAYALQCLDPRRDLQTLLELRDVESGRELMAYLGLRDVVLVERKQDAAHLRQLEQRVEEIAGSGAAFVLTGHAQSIQLLRRSLKGCGVPASRVIAKAYWAPGKTGLD